MKSGTIGGLLVGGFLLKTVGWRVIIFSVGIYGGIYMYERMTWTNQAKCKEFKKQYVDHAARKLRLVVDMTSANCSHQVHKTGTHFFAKKNSLHHFSQKKWELWIHEFFSMYVPVILKSMGKKKTRENEIKYINFTNNLAMTF